MAQCQFQISTQLSLLSRESLVHSVTSDMGREDSGRGWLFGYTGGVGTLGVRTATRVKVPGN